MKTLCTYVCIYTHKKWLYICIFMIHSLLRTALRTFAHNCLWMTICWILDFFRKSVYIFKSLDMNPTKNSPVKLAACWSAVTWPSLSKAHPYTRFLLWRTKKLRESTCMWAWNEYPGNQKTPRKQSKKQTKRIHNLWQKNITLQRLSDKMVSGRPAILLHHLNRRPSSLSFRVRCRFQYRSHILVENHLWR